MRGSSSSSSRRVSPSSSYSSSTSSTNRRPTRQSAACRFLGRVRRCRLRSSPRRLPQFRMLSPQTALHWRASECRPDRSSQRRAATCPPSHRCSCCLHNSSYRRHSLQNSLINVMQLFSLGASGQSGTLIDLHDEYMLIILLFYRFIKVCFR